VQKIVVVGAGPAGILAAIKASEQGNEVIILEKNEKIGKKLFITGKGRCNITNACDTSDFFESVVSNPKFLYSAIYNFDNHQMIQFIEELGCKTKVERGERVFPVSDHSSDVISALKRELNKQGIRVFYHAKVGSLLVEDELIKGVKLSTGKEFYADKVLVATGGISYPLTGSTGDGYRFAESVGHTIVPYKPALSALDLKGHIHKKLQGLSLRNISLRLVCNEKVIYEDFGELLFTHFGVSGPVILSASSYLAKNGIEKDYEIQIDLKPALSDEQLDKRILREFETKKNKEFKNAITKMFPSKMIPIIIELSEIDPYKKVHEITKEERALFLEQIKKLSFKVKNIHTIDEAIITQGGVSVKEINPSTMESKKIKGLYFAGEVLDVDALTGGYNLQIAWSTGYLAGEEMGGNTYA
jgi:predicted Rossmann fold flavoprotein